MIVARQENVIRNNSTAQEVNPLKKQKYDELKKSQIEALKTIREKDINKKLSVMKTVLLLFFVGMVIVARYSVIYANEKNIRDIKNEVSKIRYSNDDLKVELLKFKDINSVDKVAREKFKMVDPNITDTYYCDLNKSNFEDNKEKNKENHKGLIQAIKNILF